MIELFSAPEAGWLGLVAVGGFCFFAGLHEFWLGFKSQNWPSTQGVIAESYLKHSWGSKGRRNSYPRVKYRYFVDGKEFWSKKIAYHGGGGTTAAASQTVCLNYPVAKTVQVFYSPKNPRRSVLETGYGVANLVVMSIGLILFVAGAWAYASAF